MKLVKIILWFLLINSASYGNSGILFGGGYNFSKLNEKVQPFHEHKYRVGMNIGLAFEIEFDYFISIVQEVSIETRGKLDRFNNEFTEWKFTYIQLPLLLQFNFNDNTKYTVNLFAGPEFGKVLSSKLYGKNKSGVNLDLLEPLDLGVALGMGVEFPIRFGSIFLRPSYYHGIPNIFGSKLDYNAKHQNIKTKIGYKFGF